MSSYIHVEDVQTTLRGQHIHEGLSFQGEQGEVIALLGPSGCGKTTALRILAGLVAHYRGAVLIGGVSPHEAWHRMALVFQSPRLAPWRTALENVSLGLELRRGWRRRQDARERSRRYLRAVGLHLDAVKYPLAMSGGERHRVALARAFATEPEVLLMDEPFSDLDLSTRNRLWNLTLDLCRRDQRTVVMVTHNVEEAAFLADRIYVLSNKPSRTVASVPVDLPHPRDPIGDPRMAEVRANVLEVIRRAGMAEGTDLELEMAYATPKEGSLP